MDFTVGSNFYSGIRFMNIDTETLVASQNGDILNISINTDYIKNIISQVLEIGI